MFGNDDRGLGVADEHHELVAEGFVLPPRPPLAIAGAVRNHVATAAPRSRPTTAERWVTPTHITRTLGVVQRDFDHELAAGECGECGRRRLR